jgi:hypothetical protein
LQYCLDRVQGIQGKAVSKDTELPTNSTVEQPNGQQVDDRGSGRRSRIAGVTREQAESICADMIAKGQIPIRLFGSCINTFTSSAVQPVQPVQVAQVSQSAIEEQCRYMALYQGVPYGLCIERWTNANK